MNEFVKDHQNDDLLRPSTQDNNQYKLVHNVVSNPRKRKNKVNIFKDKSLDQQTIEFLR